MLCLFLLMGIHALTRKVSWDCMIAYDGSRYSVPYAYAGTRVWLRVSQGRRLEILSPTGAALTTHGLSVTKGGRGWGRTRGYCFRNRPPQSAKPSWRVPGPSLDV